MTAYIVLKQQSSSQDTPGAADRWEPHATEVLATSAEAAIRLACQDLVTGKGTFVAIPARSWKPVTVQAVQTTTIKLGEAT